MKSKAAMSCEHLKTLVREVPDFPKKGILFYDITTLLKDKVGFATLIDALSEHFIARDIDLVLGIEARGFIFGPALAYRLNAGFVPIRKPHKLPAETVKWTMIWNTARTRWRYIKTRSSPDNGSSSWTICWQRAEPPMPACNWRSPWAEKWKHLRLWWSWTS
jgi:hypothetical protein